MIGLFAATPPCSVMFVFECPFICLRGYTYKVMRNCQRVNTWQVLECF